jgi:hypothetical protein
MNHLEQLVSEWLQYKDYFVRASVQVGPRAKGGFDGELDIVGFDFDNQHLIHVECSLDAASWKDREIKFSKKFERGRKYAKNVFKGFALPDDIDQVALLQFSGDKAEIGGARIVTVKSFIREILDGLKGTSPASGAVPSTFPLIRTLQLAIHAQGAESNPRNRLIRA